MIQPMLDSRAIYKARVDAAIAFMHQHLADDLKLESLAQVAHFSAFHFHRIFSAIIGETPQQFLNRVRLEKAANMLIINPARSITQIALACGFSSSATFARSFKKYFGMTANQYRNIESKPLAGGTFSLLQSDHQIPELKIEIHDVPALNLAYVSNLKGYDIDLICPAWKQLFRWANAHELITKETIRLGLSLDDPLITSPEKCRYYACITIPYGVMPQDPIGHMQLSEGKCAVAHVTCSIDEIQQIYLFLYRSWLMDSGYQPADQPPYEIYRSTPETNPEGKFVLDVHIPIVPL